MNQETKLTKFIQTETRLEKIQSQEDVELAMAQNKRAKTLIDWAEDRRIEATKPMLEAKKKVDNIWKQRIEPLVALINSNKSILQVYLEEQEATKVLELKDLDFTKKEAGSLAKIEAKSESGVSYRTDWDLQVENINLVPEKFIIKTLDEKLIKEHLRNGGKFVKGVKITEKKIIVTR